MNQFVDINIIPSFSDQNIKTYLADESEYIKASKAEKEAPACSEHSETVELGQDHSVHHEAANYHEGKLGRLVSSKVSIQSRCHIEHSICEALDMILHIKGSSKCSAKHNAGVK